MVVLDEIDDNNNLIQVNIEIEKLRVRLRERLLIDTNLKIMKGLKSFLEDFVILILWTSTIFKLNIISIFDFTLIILFQIYRSPGMIRHIMNLTSIIFFVRLLVVLSNLDQSLNKMQYPTIFQNKNDQGLFDDYWKFYIPWIDSVLEMDGTETDH